MTNKLIQSSSQTNTRFEMLRTPIGLFCVFLLLAVPLAGFRQIFDGSASFFISYDNVEQFYPWYQKLSEAIHHGYLPIWDANALSGHSLAGEFQSGIFYPINILWVAVFGSSTGIPIRALEWLVLFHYGTASVFMFLLARKLRLNFPASTVAALLYAYTGDFADRASGQTCIFFGNVYVPLAAYFALTCTDARRLRWAAFAGICIGLQVLAGHLEPPSIGGLLVFTILIVDCLRKKDFKFSVLATLIVIVAAVCFSSPQLFFGFQYLSHAYRWVMAADGPIHGTGGLAFTDYAATAFSPSQLLNVFDPRNHDTPDGNLLYIGCLPLVVLAVGFAISRSRIVAARLIGQNIAIVVLACFAFLMLLGPITPVAGIIYHVPFATAAVRELGRYAILIQLMMVIAVGAVLTGLDASSESFRDIFKRRWELFAIALSLVYCTFIKSVLINGVPIAAIVILALTAIVFIKSYRSIVLSGLIALEIVMALPAMAKPTSFETYPLKRFAMNSLLEPSETCYPDCRLVILDDVVPANIGDVFPIQTFYGKGATMYQPYFDLLGAGGFDPHGFIEDALNVRYIISGHEMAGFRMVSRLSNPERYLYERPNYFPRVFSLVALEKRERAANDVQYKIDDYGDLFSDFLVTVPKAETVVFAEQFYSGWVVSVDGKPAQMLAVGIVNAVPILRAVDVGTGVHHVRFDYPR